MEELINKQNHLLSSVTTKKVSVSYHKVNISFLEGVFARGDRRLNDVVEYAWRHGCKFDSWDDSFLFDVWLDAFKECGVDPLFYTSRKRAYEEILPWDHLDYGIRKQFLINESKKAYENETTPHCRIKCAGCGTNMLNGGKCDALCQSMV